MDVTVTASVSSFGSWVRARRKELGLTQPKLALCVACAVQTINKIESGARTPSEHMAQRLAECLEVDLSERRAFVEYACCKRPETERTATDVDATAPWRSFRRPRQLQYPNNLPSPPNDFIGRQREIAAISSLLRRPGVRLVTLTGPAGTGKTRLSLQVAATLSGDFPDGVFFVPLSSVADPTLVVSAIASAVHTREAARQPLLETLHAHLRDKQLLLLLDNFEQVVVAAPVVSQLLASAPHLKVMVTSRVVLHIYGEHDFQIPPLALPCPEQEGQLPLLPAECLAEYEAVHLFVERAQSAKADFALTGDNASVIVDICRRLDGLPLAIELAAARVRLLTPQAMLARLSSQLGSSTLDLLTGGAQDLPSRQQTMRNAIEWSYNLLDEQERALFRRLSVFAGGCTIESAQAVAIYFGEDAPERNKAPYVLDGLDALLNKSLLRREDGADLGGEPRYNMPNIIREYAHERLKESGEGQHTRDSHAHYFLAMSEKAELGLRSSKPAALLERLETERDNLRAALQWALESGQLEVGLRMAGALWRFWYQHSHFREGQKWLVSFLSAPEIAGSEAEPSRVLNDNTVKNSEIGVSYNKPGRELVAHALAEALLGAGTLAWRQGDFVTARPYLEGSLRVCRQMGNKQGSANALNGLAFIADEHSDHTTARVLYEESLALRRELGDKGGIACSLANLGEVARCLGDYAGARVYYEKSLEIRIELDDKNSTRILFHNLGHVALNLGDAIEAATFFAESLSVAQESGNKQAIAECLAGLGGIAAVKGQALQAAKLFGASQALLAAIHSRLVPADEIEYQRNLVASRLQLDEASWTEACGEGRRLTVEQAIDYALREAKED